MSNDRDRIVALLALARHQGTPRHEAETALAMASKLMQRNGWSESDVGSTGDTDESIIVQQVEVHGTYAAQRRNLLYAIALVHSCVGYQTRNDDGSLVMVLYGRRDDIFAARTLFAAADLMGCRMLPRGDRSWRVSWWKGFRFGIEEALGGARTEYARESPGAGLVLASRSARAARELRTHGPALRRTYSYVDDAASSYTAGVSAGRSFGAHGRSFGAGVRGELA